MTGGGLKLRMSDSKLTDVGFVKNEFVLANSEVEAIRRAFERVRTLLTQQVDAGGLVIEVLNIEVDEVGRSNKFWKLVQQEGFIFFPKGEASSLGSALH